MREALLRSRAVSHIKKVEQELLQGGVSNFLQSRAVVITKWDTYYKMGQLYHKFG